MRTASKVTWMEAWEVYLMLNKTVDYTDGLKTVDYEVKELSEVWYYQETFEGFNYECYRGY